MRTFSETDEDGYPVGPDGQFDTAAWAMRKRIQAAGIPARFAGCTLESYQTPEPGQAAALEAVREWVERYDGKSSLILMGQTGSGKTHLAIAALRAVLERTSITGHYANVPDLLAMMRRDWDAKDADGAGAEAFDRAQTGALVVLDDLGAEKLSEWAREQAYLLIDHRYAWCLPTIITTNLDAAALSVAYGDRITSRLVEMGEWVEVIVQEDWRGRKS
jgi:DNA replication protein DnaC